MRNKPKGKGEAMRKVGVIALAVMASIVLALSALAESANAEGDSPLMGEDEAATLQSLKIAGGYFTLPM
jgi:hypothetical protein